MKSYNENIAIRQQNQENILLKHKHTHKESVTHQISPPRFFSYLADQFKCLENLQPPSSI